MRVLYIELNRCPSDYIKENLDYGIGLDILRQNLSYELDKEANILIVYASAMKDLEKVVSWLTHPRNYVSASKLEGANQRVPEWDWELRFHYKKG